MSSPIEGSEPLKLTSLEVENILRLRACHLVMNEEGALIVEGANEAGKSSVLRSLEILLAGMSQTPDEPIHGGEEKGRIVGKFGDLVVSKTFGRGKRPILKVTQKRAKFSSPQKILDELLDHVALDPLKFMGQDAKTQLAVLSDLMGVDEGALDRREQEAYEQRRDANRIVRDLEGSLASLNVDPSAPAEEISVADLMAELDKVQEHNARGAELEAAHMEARSECLELMSEVADLVAQLSALRQKVAKSQEEAEKARVSMTEFEPREEDEIRAKIATVDETNRKVRDNVLAAKITAQLDEAKKTAETHDQDLKAIEQERGELRMEAHSRLPIKELSITDGGVFYKGKPLAQAGSSAQLRVSVAVAMALNQDKRIRLLLVDDAEKLDAGNTRLVLEMAREAGFQVLMARVGAGGESAIVIEDGVVSNE